MNLVQCDACGSQFPMNDTVMLWARALCVSCAERALKNAGKVPEGAVRRQVDPTVCANCRLDNGSTSLGTVAGLPVCDRCAHFLRHRPFPNWVRIAAVALVGLVALAVFRNARFFRAYHEMRASFRAAGRADAAEAADLMESASKHVPESTDLRMVADFFRGVQLLQEGQSAEALAYLEKVQALLPAEFEAAEFVLQARIGKCFDEKDYDGFLEAASEMARRRPREPMALGQMASAYACKYAVTGDDQFKQESLQALEQAKALAKDAPSFQEYEDRILHRIQSREIISREEFKTRYPDGWRGKEEPER